MCVLQLNTITNNPITTASKHLLLELRIIEYQVKSQPNFISFIAAIIKM